MKATACLVGMPEGSDEQMAPLDKAGMGVFDKDWDTAVEIPDPSDLVGPPFAIRANLLPGEPIMEFDKASWEEPITWKVPSDSTTWRIVGVELRTSKGVKLQPFGEHILMVPDDEITVTLSGLFGEQ